MIAVDTNVVVRLLTEDDRKQAAAARALFAAHPIWISKTLLLETAWVLQSAYELSDSSIIEALSGLVALRNVHMEDKAMIIAALDLARTGLELADAFHLVNRPTGADFVSFDRALIRRAKRAGVKEASIVPPV